MTRATAARLSLTALIGRGTRIVGSPFDALRHADYEVAVFASGEDFLASVAMRVSARVILDVHMPRLSGFPGSRLRPEAQWRAGTTKVP